MANAYTGTSALSNLIQTAYDKLIEFNLRAQPLFRNVADKRVAQPTHNSNVYTFQLYADLTPVTSALSETTDPDSVAVGNTTTVQVTMTEYGNVVLKTRKLELFSLAAIDPAIANMVSFNMADSFDWIVQGKLVGAGTNFWSNAGTITALAANAGATDNTSGGAGCTTVTASGKLDSPSIRYAVTKLRANKVVPRRGTLYEVIAHPEVVVDLRTDSGATGWRDPHNYSAPGNIWAGEVGEYEGAYFVENPRCFNSQIGSGAGGTQVRVFNTYVLGQQALAEAVAEEPHIVIGEITDKLKRFTPVGWYGVAGWAAYRTAALYQINSASSVHPNA